MFGASVVINFLTTVVAIVVVAAVVADVVAVPVPAAQLHEGHIFSLLFETTMRAIKKMKDNSASTKITIFHNKGMLKNPPNRTKIRNVKLHLFNKIMYL